MTDAEYEGRFQLQQSADRAMEAWNEANVAAARAERRLARAWSLFERGQQAPPEADLLYEVNHLRAAANHKLIDAMLHLRALTEPQG